MSSKDGHDERLQLPNWKFCIILAEEVNAFKDESACDCVTEARIQQSMVLTGHCPTLIPEGFCPFYCVCKLKDVFRAILLQDKCCDDEVATTVQKGV